MSSPGANPQNNDQNGTRTYVLGHSEGELTRLERQAELFAEATEDMLRRAGVSTGMRILDVGCGVGDVAMVAARLVGSTGSVLGIDRAGEALGMARRRAESAGYGWLKFENGDLHEFDAGAPYDGVTGRFILMYLVDPAAAIARLAKLVRPGGLIAFGELDIDQSASIPKLPLLYRCIYWTTETYRRAGIEPNMGSGLAAAFRRAGLTARMQGTTRIDSGADSVAYQFAAQTIRSLLPRMVEMGVADEAEVEVETLAERLKAESLAADACNFLPRFVAAWARTPG